MAISKALIDLLTKGLDIAPSSAFTHGGRATTDLLDYGEAIGLINNMAPASNGDLIPYGKGPLAPNGQPVEQLYGPIARDQLAANKAIDEEFKALFGNMDDSFVDVADIPDEYDENGFLKLTPGPTKAAAAGGATDALIKAAKDAEAKYAAEEIARRDAKIARQRNTGETDAEMLLSMLRAGRANEVTNSMFPTADTPELQEQAFNEYLSRWYDLPMDPASRAERAKQMGFGDQRWFRGSNSNSPTPRAHHVFAADDPDVAATYTNRDGGNITPLRFLETPRDVNVSPQKENTRWSAIPANPSTAITTRRGDTIDPTTLRSGDGSSFTTTDDLISSLTDKGHIRRNAPNTVTFEGIIDHGGQHYQGAHPTGASNVIATPSKKGIRSTFARFDPRLAHIDNLLAGFGGAGALGFGAAALSPGQADAAAAPPQEDVQAKLLSSINQFVQNAPKRPAGPVTGGYAEGDPRNTPAAPSILDLLPPPEAAPDTRNLKDRAAAGIDEALNYYLGGTGIPERLAMMMPNPVGSLQDSMVASGEMLAPGKTAMERVGSAGEMLSNLGMAALEGVPMGATGRSMGRALADTGEDAIKRALADEAGSLDLAPWRGIGDNGGPSMGRAIDTVDLPPGSDPRYLGAAPDRSGGSFPRYTPKKVPERMQRLIAAADDPKNPINAMFDNYIERGKKLQGSDWYNTEEMRDWFVDELGEKDGDARWREFVDLIGATSTGSAVPDNLRNASFYNALSETDRANVAELVKGGGITPAAAARKLGIKVPNMPPEKGPGSYNYGHVMQGNHAANVLNQIDGKWMRMPPEGLKGAELTKWLQANPKVKGFANSMLGDTKNIAADKHFMRMLAMADGSPDFLSEQAGGSVEMLDTLRKTYGKAIEPYIMTRDVKGKPTVQVNLAKAAKDGVIKDASALQGMPTAWSDTPSATEYAALEEMANRLAKKYDMTPAQFQANLWMGAGDITGLADESQGTAMELFRRTLDKRAGERGLTRKEMLRDFIVNRAPLAIGPMGAIGLLNSQGKEQEGGI